MLQICPNLPDQKFIDPPLEEEILVFIRKLGYSVDIKSISDVKIDTLHQPWRTFRTIVNKCLSGKVIGLEQIRLSRAQILWGMYYLKNVDYVYLLWEDLVYQIKNKVSKKKKDMYYPRFTKVIINHFMSKDQSILRRNKVDWHMARDDPILTTMRYISKHEVVQKYGAILPDTLTNQEMKESNAYKTYYDFASRKEIPKPKYVRPSTREKTVQPPKASLGQKLKTTTKVAKSGKKKIPVTVSKAKGLETLSEVALSEAEQIKLATKRNKKEFHMSHASGSGDGVDFQSKVPDEQQQKVTGTNKGAGVRPEDYAGEETDVNDDSEETESDNNGDDLTHPKLLTYKARDDEVKEGKEEQEEEELYGDLNINLQRIEQQSSSVSSELVSKFINPSPNTGIDSILSPNNQSETLVNILVFITTKTPSSNTTIPQPPIPNIQPLQQTPKSKTTKTIPTTTLPDIPNFACLFQFDQQLREKAQAENQEFLNQVDSAMKTIIKEQVQAQVSKILPKIKKYVIESLEAKIEVEMIKDEDHLLDQTEGQRDGDRAKKLSH
nr:hypothetical protein [Tanacetum cinerariifolium]